MCALGRVQRGDMMKVLKWLGIGVLCAVLLAAGAVAWNLFGRPFSFNLLVDRQSIAFAMRSPEIMTSVGLVTGGPLDRHSNRLNDVSLAQRDSDYAFTEKLLRELDSYRDPKSYSGQTAITYQVWRRNLSDNLAYKRFPWVSRAGFTYAADQFWAAPTGIAVFLQTQHPVTSKELAQDYVARIRASGRKLDDIGKEVERQAGLGVIPPDFIIRKTLDSMRSFTAHTPDANPMLVDFSGKVDKLSLGAKDKAELKQAALQALQSVMLPAYGRLIATMEGLLPKATSDAGVWKLPDGAAYYALQVRTSTTSDYTPDQIHAMGLSEVARIEQEMEPLLQALGLKDGSVGVRMRALAQQPEQHYPDGDAGRAAILAQYKAIARQIETTIVPTTFSRTPKAVLEIQRMQPFEEIGAPLAYYNPPALNGSRPGIFFANLRDVPAVTKFSQKTLVAHEGVPGHHFQIALAQEISGLPLVRRVLPFNAFAEGWALYAERLVAEQGLYKDDPSGDLGRLQAEMFRAVRLVVDTGIHAQRWSRERAIAYMIEKTGMADGEVENEIDRYITGPGQALGYKVGQLKILELRDRAKAALGPRFDIKAFHAQVLENGALPLSVLDAQIDAWIKATAQSSPA